MAKTYPLRILTHEELVFEGKVESLMVPGALGYLGVLSHHAPLITTLNSGQLSFKDADEKTHRYSIKGGVLEVSNNQAVLLTESIQPLQP
ncbi:MAG: ATP synthase F1 subunit epsilon [bacterium]|jgi:F-type H+-transporting ATPase subunit epsilon|nr:ATP synthase F1 subunit epsilon [bacterium]